MVAKEQSKIDCSSMQFLQMAAESKTVRGKKFKITSKHLWDAEEDNSSDKIVKVIADNGQNKRFNGGGSKRSKANVLAKASMAVNSCKRKPEMSLDGQRWKKQKMDRLLKLQLHKIVRELIHHPFGWVFSEPVDPVEVQAPDYFLIITKPMDLGTVLHKLEENMYSGADEFAADVKLTFSNALTYNPPGTDVYCWAEELDAAFSRKWKLVEAKLKQGKKNDEHARFVDHNGNNDCDIKQIGDNFQNVKPMSLKRAPLPVKLGSYRLMSLDEKQKFRLELVQVISRKMIDKTQTVFQKFGLAGINKERVDSYIDTADDETLWKLRREVKVLLGTKDGKVKAGKIELKMCSSLNSTVEKEHFGRIALVSTNLRQSLDSACLGNGAAQGCASEISSEGSTGKINSGDSNLKCEVKYPSELLTSSSGVDSDGPGVVVNEESSSHLSTPACVEGWTLNIPMSPKKALRAALLKKRFADTIFRATHQELLDHSENSDPSRMQHEREKLEREQREEKARIEAQIKAAEAASRRREQENYKMRRERERKVARMLLEKIEKSVEINDNVGILEDLEMMGCRYLYHPIDVHGLGFDGIHHGNPLERLGLYLNDAISEEGKYVIMNREEGEILS